MNDLTMKNVKNQIANLACQAGVIPSEYLTIQKISQIAFVASLEELGIFDDIHDGLKAAYPALDSQKNKTQYDKQGLKDLFKADQKDWPVMIATDEKRTDKEDNDLKDEKGNQVFVMTEKRNEKQEIVYHNLTVIKSLVKNWKYQSPQDKALNKYKALNSKYNDLLKQMAKIEKDMLEISEAFPEAFPKKADDKEVREQAEKVETVLTDKALFVVTVKNLSNEILKNEVFESEEQAELFASEFDPDFVDFQEMQVSNYTTKEEKTEVA